MTGLTGKSSLHSRAATADRRKRASWEGMSEMRGPIAVPSPVVLVVGLLAASLLAPAPGWAREQRDQTNRQLCRRYTKQIAHYENDVLPLAEERGNELWAEATLDQIDRLKNQRADVCPEYTEERNALRRAAAEAAKVQRMMKTAAKAAASYFSGGMW